MLLYYAHFADGSLTEKRGYAPIPLVSYIDTDNGSATNSVGQLYAFSFLDTEQSQLREILDSFERESNQNGDTAFSSLYVYMKVAYSDLVGNTHTEYYVLSGGDIDEQLGGWAIWSLDMTESEFETWERNIQALKADGVELVFNASEEVDLLSMWTKSIEQFRQSEATATAV